VAHARRPAECMRNETLLSLCLLEFVAFKRCA